MTQPELVAGCRVLWYGHRGEVLAVHEDSAWVKLEYAARPQTVPVGSLAVVAEKWGAEEIQRNEG